MGAVAYVGVCGVGVVLGIYLEVGVLFYFGDGAGVEHLVEMGVVGGLDGDDVKSGGVVDMVGVHFFRNWLRRMFAVSRCRGGGCLQHDK